MASQAEEGRASPALSNPNKSSAQNSPNLNSLGSDVRNDFGLQHIHTSSIASQVRDGQQHGAAQSLSPRDLNFPTQHFDRTSPVRPRFMQRKSSNVSMATSALDLDAIPDYNVDDEGSDYGIFDDDDSGSINNTTMQSMKKNTTPNGENGDGTTRSSVDLSSKADQILANAKKRLNLMDQNLKGARALTAENLQRAASLSLETSRSNMLSPIAGQTASQQMSNGLGPITGVSRSKWPTSPLRSTRSQELPRLARDRQSSLPITISGRPSHRATNSLSPISDDVGNISPVTSDLKQQVNDLNKRISLLRDRTREDNLRRQSLQSLRSVDQSSESGHNRKTSSTQANPNVFVTTTDDPGTDRLGGLRWGNGPINRIATSVQELRSPDSDISIYSTDVSPMTAKWRAQKRDWTPVAPSSLEVPRSVPMRINGQNGSVQQSSVSITPHPVSNYTDNIDPYKLEDQRNHLQPHEDRSDAFDYQRLFLHSALGMTRPSEDASSVASDDTARGNESRLETNNFNGSERLKPAEQSLRKRFGSIESLNSNVSFTTAAESGRSRQSSPSKRLLQSDVPEVATANHDKDQQSITRQVALQVSLIDAPAAAIALAAISPAIEKNPLGLRDKAIMFKLIECIRTTCDKLSDNDLDPNEAQLLRKRLEDATKLLDGSNTTNIAR